MGCRRRRGFTLVELLVVIGIIAVLLGILVPVLAGARDRARTVQCASNIRQVMFAMMAYANDREDYPLSDDAGWRFGRTPRTWVDTMAALGYLKLPNLAQGDYGILTCPSVEDSKPMLNQVGSFGPHYAYNIYVNSWIDRASPLNRDLDQQFLGRRSRMTKNVQDKILLVDVWSYDSTVSNGSYTETRATYGAHITRQLIGLQFISGHADPRHTRGTSANVAYLDGHVQLANAQLVHLTAEQDVPEQPFSTYHFARDR